MEGESRWMGKQQQMQVNLFHLDQMVVTDQRGNLMHQEEVVGQALTKLATGWRSVGEAAEGGNAQLVRMGRFLLRGLPGSRSHYLGFLNLSLVLVALPQKVGLHLMAPDPQSCLLHSLHLKASRTKHTCTVIHKHTDLSLYKYIMVFS